MVCAAGAKMVHFSLSLGQAKECELGLTSQGWSHVQQPHSIIPGEESRWLVGNSVGSRGLIGAVSSIGTTVPNIALLMKQLVHVM